MSTLKRGLLICGLATAPALATLERETLFQVEELPSRESHHVVALSDFSIPAATDGRVHIVNTDSGAYLGLISTGYWYSGVRLPRSRNVLVSPETYFARGSRGKRTDVVSIYDGTTLSPIAEVEIPPKRFTAVKMQGSSVLTDDDRFLAVLNHTPAASVSIVDLVEQQFVTEIEIPGCFNIYPTGPRSFMSICGDGAFLRIALDKSGIPVSKTRTASLFDAAQDPLTVSGVRDGDSWHFVSKDGVLHSFLATADSVTSVGARSLFTDAERADNWRISGFQHLAVHSTQQRAYLLVHQGDPETFEDPGTEVWVYDLGNGLKIEEIALERMAMSIEVSQDADSQLYAIALDFNLPFLFQTYIYLVEGVDALLNHTKLVLDVYDTANGELLRRIPDVGTNPTYIQTWPATVLPHGD